MASMNFTDLTPVEKKQILLQRLKIEQSFNSIKYKAVPLGPILGYFFKHTPHFEVPKLTLSSSLKQIFSVLSKFGWRRNDTPLAEIVLVHYSQRKKDWGILDGAYERLPREKVSRFYDANFVQSYSITDLLTWAAFWLRSFRSIRREIDEIIIRHKCETVATSTILFYLLLNSLYLQSSLSRLSKSRVKLVFFTYDKGPYSSILAQAAKSLGIRTAAIIHGSSFHLPLGYVPPVATELLVWGKQHVAIFKSYDVDEDRMHVVGFPNLKKPGSSPSDIRKSLGVPIDRKAVLFVSQSFEEEYSRVDLFLKEAEGLSGWIPVIKLHPSTTAFNEIKTRIYGRLAILLPLDTSPADAIEACDIVVGLSSTLLIEALSLQKPVVVFNPTNTVEEGIGKYLTTYGSAPKFSSAGSLRQFLSQVLSDETLLRSKDQFEYFKYLCSFRAEDADKLIYGYICDATADL